MRKLTVMFLAMIMVFLGTASAALAKEPATPQLTIEDVMRMAVENSTALKSGNLAKDQAWEARKDAADDVSLRPSGGGGPVNEKAESSFTKLMQTSNRYLTQSKLLQQEEKNVKLDAYQKYISVLISQEKIKNAEITLAKDQLAERLAKICAQVGTISNPEMVAAQSTVQASAAALQEAIENLDKAYVELNAVIGLWPEDRPILQDEIAFETFKVDNINAEASRAETSSEALWSLQQLVNLQKMDLSYFRYGPGSGALSSYDIEKIDVDIAELNVEEARKEVRNGVFTLYKDIQAAEEQYNKVNAAIKLMEETLRVAKVKYDVGMATAMDIKTSEAELASYETNLALLKYQHAILVANFKNLTGKELV
ncbi:Outer membrane efflux protein [Sporotomaculum syntrophicum]|uniref:Outer membrane efflux protein n=1 Tax=Sporotomaculum syntrophicum TaxID=182264 RepID=A0A9D3AZ03_9FIRM|nr:TolC family protein [Sporotomaculum syntrophicum]KAF1086036.1 Outer membrane efflux protein [Sporotomaculum syntrophicum]